MMTQTEVKLCDVSEPLMYQMGTKNITTRELCDIIYGTLNSLIFSRDLRGNSITYILKQTFSELDTLINL